MLVHTVFKLLKKGPGHQKFSKTLKTMNTSVECQYCQTSSFVSILRLFDLRIEEHEPVNNNSLIVSMAKVLGKETSEIQQAIDSHKDDSQFSSLAFLELGLGFSRSSDYSVFSLLARLGAISEQFRTTIFVFCDPLSLRSLHNGAQCFIVKPSVDSDTLSVVSCIVTDGSLVHPSSMTQQPFTDNLEVFKYEANVNYFGNNLQVAENQNMERDVHFIDTDTDNNILEREDLGETANNQNGPHDDVIHNDSLTIDELLMRNFRNNDPRDITGSTYNSTSKLDLFNSTVAPEQVNIKRTFDIDGFFGFLEVEQFAQSVTCAVRLNVFPTQADPRSVKNIRGMLGRIEQTPLYCYNFGKIDLPFGVIDLIFLVSSIRNISITFVNEAISRSSIYARSLPCSSDAIHSVMCGSESVRDAHRSTMRATTRTHFKTELEDYSKEVATCYLYHFKKKLLEELALVNFSGDIKIFFKSIGSKAALRKSSVYDMIQNINLFGAAIKFESLDLSNTFVDFCIAGTARCNGPIGSVTNYLFI